MSRYDALYQRIESGEKILINGATGTEVEIRGVPQIIMRLRHNDGWIVAFRSLVDVVELGRNTSKCYGKAFQI